MTEKQFDILGIGNAIVDIFIDISEEDFQSLNFKKGLMTLVEAEEQQELLKRFATQNPVLVSGGSVGNSIIAMAQLGSKAAFIGCVSDDRYGLHYGEEFSDLGINFLCPPTINKVTGTCVVLVTPDGERTMRTCLGVAGLLGSQHMDEKAIQASKGILVEGYLLASPPAWEAVQDMLNVASEHSIPVIATLSGEFIVQYFTDAVRTLLQSSVMVIANLEEARAYTKKEDYLEVIAALAKEVPAVVITDGPNGAYICSDGETIHVPAFPSTVRDATGAGDMFTGAYLHGLNIGLSPAQAAKGACYLAHRVIEQVGARMQGDIKELWKGKIS